MINDSMTPGPAISFATIPETTYIPVPPQLPTPREARSRVVKHLERRATEIRLSSLAREFIFCFL